VSDFVDAEDGEAYGSSDADAEQNFCRSRYLVIGTDGFDLSGVERLASELANAIHEDNDRLIESLIA
jgi:hypothetical protein